MKVRNWTVGILALVILFAMFEIPYHLHGSEWALWLAEICIGIVGLGSLYFLAKWADKKDQQDAERKWPPQ